MEDIASKKVSEIALKFPQTTRLFEKFNIDYCCGGNRPLREACETAGLKPEVIVNEITKQIENRDEMDSTIYPEHLPVANLVDHIIAKHHIFTIDEIQRLTPLMDKVCKRHGTEHPELYEISRVFDLLASELTLHLRKEENVLFPYIKVLAAVEGSNIPVAVPHFKTVQNPVRMMMNEHDTAGVQLKEIRELSDNFTLPSGACASYTALYNGLEELENDLHQHIHLENNVLFPKAIEIEDNVVGSGSDKIQDFECNSANF
ncbi:MAG: iron-sulfur cluster repair di-iron protein [Pyrinomonadaceae bacterium]